MKKIKNYMVCAEVSVFQIVFERTIRSAQPFGNALRIEAGAFQ